MAAVDGVYATTPSEKATETGSAAFGTARAATPRAIEPALPTEFVDPEAVVRTSVASLAGMVAAIDRAAPDASVEGKRLRTLRDQVYPQLGWIKVQADDEMRALSNGRFRTGVWAGVFESGHEQLEKWSPTLRSIRRGDSEREMRDGFYVVALADRAGRNNGLDRPHRCQKLDALLNAASKE